MPLPPPTARRTHTNFRNIHLDGYERDDGCWDIEARLTDVRLRDCALPSGLRKKGEPLHDMWLRVTIDLRMNVLDAVACIDAMPFEDSCPGIAPDYSTLIGLNLLQGFRKAVMGRFSGTRGCSHITELATLLPSVAMQTMGLGSESDDCKPFELDRCHALDSSHSEVVRRFYPRWFREQKTG